jgi:hypothetical protein
MPLASESFVRYRKAEADERALFKTCYSAALPFHNDVNQTLLSTANAVTDSCRLIHEPSMPCVYSTAKDLSSKAPRLKARELADH